MKKNWIIAGSLISVMLMATLGTVIAADDIGTVDATAIDTEVMDEPNLLITPDQMAEIKTEEREMIQATIMENLETYGLTDEEIMEVEELMDALDVLHIEARETRQELVDEGLTRDEIRAEMEPAMLEIQDLRAELKELLEGYGIEMPDQPLQQRGHARANGQRGQGGQGMRQGGAGMGGQGMRHGGQGQGMHNGSGMNLEDARINP